MATAAVDGPTYPELRRRIAELMLSRGEWAGCPMPIEGLSLHIEPTYPYAGLADCLAGKKQSDPDLDENGLRPGERLVNSWYSRRREAHVFVVQNAEGRASVFALYEKNHARRLSIVLKSFEAAWAHDIETEYTAMMTLSEHITNEQMRQFIILGQFIEMSKRSKVAYLFRRARPTIAIRATEQGSKVLAVLCLHPIAYYRETFVGAMTPTDDVLAHLMLMRGDEVMFWRRANQHSPDDPEAAI